MKTIPKLTLDKHSIRYIQVPYENRYFVCRYTYRLPDGKNGMYVDYAKVPKGLPRSVIQSIINGIIGSDGTQAIFDRIEHFFDSVAAKDEYLDRLDTSQR